MLSAHILTACLLVAGIGDPPATPAPDPPAVPPRVTLWTNHGDDAFERGDEMTVYFRTDVDAYVLIFRVDADGNAGVLYPRTPADDNFARGGEAVAVPGARPDYTLRVQEYPGQGFLFALVTLDPVAFDVVARDGAWDYEALGLARRITIDPYIVFGDLLAAFVPESYVTYDHMVLPYHVGGPHGYPRFTCYQCHAYVSPAAWNPYAHSCIRVDVAAPAWWRYPYGLYAGTDVVLPPHPVAAPGATTPRAESPRPAPADRGRTLVPRVRRPAAVDGRRPAPAAVTVAPPARRDAQERAPAPGRRASARDSGSKAGETAARPAPRRRTDGERSQPARRTGRHESPQAG